MAKKPEKKGTKTPEQAPQPGPGTDVALRGGKDLILASDAPADHIKQGQGRGSENVRTEDLVIPRLEIVQALSPQVKQGDPKYNPQARPGNLFNTVTGQLYGPDTFIVPVFFQKMFNVWMMRKTPEGKALPGGFFGSYADQTEASDRAEKEGGAAKYIEVVDTPQHLCLLVDAASGTVAEIMLSMPRTKAKVSRNFNSMVRLSGGDRFSRVYRIQTTLEKNPKGDFYNYLITPIGQPAKPLYDRAEKLYQQVASGVKKVRAHEDDAPDGGDGNAEM